MHWDDDDFHEPHRISAQVAPIARGEADLSAIEHTHMLAMPSQEVYAWPSGTHGWKFLWSSLTYSAALAKRLRGFVRRAALEPTTPNRVDAFP